MFKLETDRLILRDMSLEDECAFVAMSQDAKYQRFYDESDCEPNKYRELTQLFVAQALEVPRQSFQLAVESKDSGKFIGTVCLRLEGDRQASMGCAFSELGIHRIYAETISKNLAAIKLCKSLGMKQEACFKDHRFFKGQWWDTVVLAVVRSDWGKA
ncbi:GNAT family N-acetyltransferase [Vibrio splendidus]|uniref:GNAT family N-acetyltransferase n=1 Tax=Vibrio splendidus TaxID=29497 RepID=UPI000D339F72|nr:GNAT family protein [Vibrio splendidus]PTP90861.1 GNAT family N-acetyltransferase [Vibrio splendidus]